MGKKFEIIHSYRRKPPKYREQALRLAAQYVKRGMKRSEALRKAYQEIKRKYEKKARK